MSALLEMAESLPGKRRVFISHCPACNKRHLDEPTSMAAWVDDSFTRSVIYGLCDACAQRMEKAGKRGRQRLLSRIEKNLEAHGVLEGIRREGMRA